MPKFVGGRRYQSRIAGGPVRRQERKLGQLAVVAAEGIPQPIADPVRKRKQLRRRRRDWCTIATGHRPTASSRSTKDVQDYGSRAITRTFVRANHAAGRQRDGDHGSGLKSAI